MRPVFPWVTGVAKASRCMTATWNRPAVTWAPDSMWATTGDVPCTAGGMYTATNARAHWDS